MRKANIGCGHDIIPDFENYDLYPSDETIQKLDLDDLPYAFNDDAFDEIQCRHTIEHLNSHPYDVMKELHRITRPGGEVIIELPIFGNLVSHRRHLHSRNYMNPITLRRKDNAYIANFFELKGFHRRQRCSIRKILWKIKTRLLTWIDSFLYDSYEWVLEAKK